VAWRCADEIWRKTSRLSQSRLAKRLAVIPRRLVPVANEAIDG